MSDESQNEIGPFSKHKFIIMISGAIVIAFIMTTISMMLYIQSGTAVDLSSPGFQSVRKEAKSSEKYDGFAGSGEITVEVLDEFQEAYDKQSKKAVGVDAFGSNVLDDASLKIDDPALMPTS